ncbi:MAG TPA: transglutaminase domain-containing protein [Noviherbaspirillum sp.]|nr:transglutaminase domain-containing protein [Noviherbaspirillum sp.]
MSPLCLPRAAHKRLPFAFHVLLLALLQPPLSQANQLNILPSEIVKAETRWRFSENATLDEEQWVQRRALSDEGAVQIGRQRFSFNTELEDFSILEAYTLKADGRKLLVHPDEVLVQRGLAVGGTAVSLPSVEMHQLTYPDVQKGDSVVWRYRKKSMRTALPGWASAARFAYPWESVLQEQVRIESPQALRLHVFAAGYDARKNQEDGLDVWIIEGKHQAFPIEQNWADSLQWLPRVYATTLPDHEAWALRFAEPIRQKSETTPAVRALAQRITKGHATSHEKARAVYDWIRSNIRYVAVHAGVGGYVPHEVEDILRKRYGDCKDQTLLMIALLKAVGIEAAPALLYTAPEYALPELPVGTDHVIVYIPELDLFADATASTIPFGSLPWNAADKPAVVAMAEGSHRMRTPAFRADDNRLIVKSVWQIARDGSADAVIEVEGSGNAATLLQDRLQQIPAGMGSVAVQRILETSRLSGRGFIHFPAVQRERQQQSMRLDLENVRNLIVDPAAGSLAPHPALNLPLYILSNMGNYAAEARRHPMTCTPVRLREDFELNLDPGFDILRIPKDAREEHADGIVFEARYTVNGNRLSGWRELILDHGRHSCNVDQYKERRAVMQRIDQHLRGSVLYTQ